MCATEPSGIPELPLSNGSKRVTCPSIRVPTPSLSLQMVRGIVIITAPAFTTPPDGVDAGCCRVVEQPVAIAATAMATRTSRRITLGDAAARWPDRDWWSDTLRHPSVDVHGNRDR